MLGQENDRTQREEEGVTHRQVTMPAGAAWDIYLGCHRYGIRGQRGCAIVWCETPQSIDRGMHGLLSRSKYGNIEAKLTTMLGG